MNQAGASPGVRCRKKEARAGWEPRSSVQNQAAGISSGVRCRENHAGTKVSCGLLPDACHDRIRMPVGCRKNQDWMTNTEFCKNQARTTVRRGSLLLGACHDYISTPVGSRKTSLGADRLGISRLNRDGKEPRRGDFSLSKCFRIEAKACFEARQNRVHGS